MRPLVAALLVWVVCAWPFGAAADAPELPTSPWELAGRDAPRIGFLDVVPVCLPDEALPEIAGAVRLAREADLDGARRLLPRAELFLGQEIEPAVALAHALLGARVATSRETWAAALELERAAHRHADPSARSCAHLERARLFLRARYGNEALGAVAIAERGALLAESNALPDEGSAGGAPVEREPILLARAEALVASGRASEATPIFEILRESESAAVAWAAKLRLSTEAPDVVWEEVARLLERGGRHRVDLDAASAFAGELALRSGRTLDALHWFSRAQADEREGELVAIRRADALAQTGRTAAANRLLLRIERTPRSGRAQSGRFGSVRAREVASIRLGENRVGSDEERENRLVRVARSDAPSIAARGLELLLTHYLESDRPDEALETAIRLNHLAPRRGVPGRDGLVDQAVRSAVAASADCVAVLKRLAGGRRLWIRSAQGPEPLLELGDCALELGLTATAIDVYRALSRRFPDRLNADFSLRIANASLELGEMRIVDAMLAANERIWSETAASLSVKAPWLWLRARSSLQRGDPQGALPVLLELVSAEATPAVERAQATRALAALPTAAIRGLDLEEKLVEALALPSDLSEVDRGQLWLRIADLRRGADAFDAATAAYERAAALLPAGPARARSLHSLAVLAAPREARVARLHRLIEIESAGAWSDLARGELRLARLQHQLGRIAQMPADPEPTGGNPE